jgi:hypothetical protein
MQPALRAVNRFLLRRDVYQLCLSTVIVLLIGLLIYYLLNDPITWVYVLAVTVVTIISVLLSFRYTRDEILYSFSSVGFEVCVARLAA